MLLITPGGSMEFASVNTTISPFDLGTILFRHAVFPSRWGK